MVKIWKKVNIVNTFFPMWLFTTHCTLVDLSGWGECTVMLCSWLLLKQSFLMRCLPPLFFILTWRMLYYERDIHVLVAVHGKSRKASYDLQVLCGLTLEHLSNVISYYFILLLALAAWNALLDLTWLSPFAWGSGITSQRGLNWLLSP